MSEVVDPWADGAVELEQILRERARSWTPARQDVPARPLLPEPDDLQPARPPRFFPFSKFFSRTTDWRSGGLSPVKDQGKTNACTCFAISSALEDLARISQPGATVVLAPLHAHVCVGRNRLEDPWDPKFATGELARQAIAEEAGVSDWSASACRAARGLMKLGNVTAIRGDADAKAWLRKGPIIAVLEYWQDLHEFYDGGVYRHASGPTTGRHTVEVVGHDREAWIIKNSYGPGWGEAGYARIAYGECGLFQRQAYGFHAVLA